MFAKYIALFAAFVTVANAQSCVFDCGNQAARDSGCSSVYDRVCVCASDRFKTEGEQCLADRCSPDDQRAGAAMFHELCD
ncbi:hypothetical protein VNI00_015664 [Paramarasmius palmivorus]|uniref:CFEM domain-containing protein n=1 Tax=Paramarasmius palmivorus TaxID=297713 RepID=A0AAW0BJM0_9AGAR